MRTTFQPRPAGAASPAEPLVNTPDAAFVEGAPPPGFSNSSARLALLGIPTPAGQCFAVRNGSDTHARLNDALITISRIRPDAPAPENDIERDQRVSALATLVELDLLDGLCGEDRMLRDDVPFWLDEINRNLRDRLASRALERLNDNADPGGLLTLERFMFCGDSAPDASPVHRAARSGHAEDLAALLDAGLPPDTPDERGATPLHEALRSGDLSCVRLLVARGASITQRDCADRAALDIAIREGHLAAVGVLIRAGAEVNHVDKAGITPLSMATQLGQLQIIDRLLTAGADINAGGARGAPIHYAIQTQNPRALEMLLKKGADVNRTAQWSPIKSQDGIAQPPTHSTAAELAVFSGKVKQVKLLQKYGVDLAAPAPGGHTLLMLAAAAGDAVMVDALLAERLPVDARDGNGCTALLWAAWHGRPAILKRLIERGAQTTVIDQHLNSALHHVMQDAHDKNIERKCETLSVLLSRASLDVNARNHQGLSALHDACFDLSGKLAAHLLVAQPKVDARDHKGRTPLALAALNGNHAVIEKLLAARANPHLVDNLGNTPLHFAACAPRHEGDKTRCIQLLLHAGAKVMARTQTLITPLHSAAAANDVEAVDQLLNAGADPAALDKARETPLEVARRLARQDVVDYFETTDEPA